SPSTAATSPDALAEKILDTPSRTIPAILHRTGLQLTRFLQRASHRNLFLATDLVYSTSRSRYRASEGSSRTPSRRLGFSLTWQKRLPSRSQTACSTGNSCRFGVSRLNQK